MLPVLPELPVLPVLPVLDSIGSHANARRKPIVSMRPLIDREEPVAHRYEQNEVCIKIDISRPPEISMNPIEFHWIP